jgi:hypothetical protein
MLVIKSIRIGAVLIRDCFEEPLHDQKTGVCCTISALPIVGRIFFKNRRKKF